MNIATDTQPFNLPQLKVKGLYSGLFYHSTGTINIIPLQPLNTGSIVNILKYGLLRRPSIHLCVNRLK